MALRPSIRMAICLTLSVLLHLMVLWPAMGRALAAAPPGAEDPPPVVPPMAPPPVEPGIERSDASTLTWVGYEEYREHLARLASIDQAAFTTAPGGSVAMAEASGAGGTTDAGADTTVPPAEVVDPVRPVEVAEPEPVPAPAQPADAAESPAEMSAPPDAAPDAATSDATPPAPSEVPAAGEAEAAGPRPLVEVAREGPLAPERPALAEVAQPAPAEPLESPDDDALETRRETDAPVVPEVRDAAADAAAIERSLADLRQAVAALASMAPIGGQGGAAPRTVVGEQTDGRDGEDPPREGEIADRQSPATSRIDVPRSQLRPDRPIAREGLEIRTREPRFHSIERLTSSPRNPVAVISFGRDGVPRKAELVLTTGDRRIDSALISSLYGWRASGLRLADLPPEGTLDMEFRIILNGR